MAGTKDAKHEELNSAFKTLAERGEDGEIYKERSHYFLSRMTKQGILETDQVVFWPYGSEAEDLKCYESHDFGDIDIMVFPNSDRLTIHEDMLKYSLENPLHVRINGRNHPVLHSCLVEDTDYVDTLTLRNFHPAIFGFDFSFMVAMLCHACQSTSAREMFSDWPPIFTTHLQNNMTSPAATFNVSHSLGTISKQWDMFKANSQNFPVDHASAEVECIIHFLCALKGIEYTREHAELVSDFVLLLMDSTYLAKHMSHFTFAHEIFDRFEETINKLEDVKSRSKEKVLLNDGQEIVKPEKSEEGDSRKNKRNCSGETVTDEKCNDKGLKNNNGSCPEITSVSHGGFRFTVTPQSRGINELSSEGLESAPRQSTMPKEISENFNTFSGKPASKRLTESEIEDEEERSQVTKNGGFKEGEREPHSEQLLAQVLAKGRLGGKGGDLKRRYGDGLHRWIACMFESGNDPKWAEETEFNESERVKSGIDFIPAFRSLEWPKVARDWINIERKWPSPDIVKKIIREGFHLVAKPPKNSEHPDCDFRISFSHAEYLLSQEMNDIQRECYRCLKRLHRAYLCTHPKSLVSFHLKNIFLQTIEETGAEIWTESNRAECMMKLLWNLLEALRRNDLRHFFVRSYNMFGVDYIENPASLKAIVVKLEQIVENPIEFTKLLIQKQEVRNEECSSRIDRSGESSMLETPATIKQHGEIECSNGVDDTQPKTAVPLLPKIECQGISPAESYRYHELKDIYRRVTKDLLDMAIGDADSTRGTLDPLERSLVEDLRELLSSYKLPVEVFQRVSNLHWNKRAYYLVWISTEPDIKRRMHVAIQGLVELLKYHMEQGNFWKEGKVECIDAFVDGMFDPSAENPFNLNNILPTGSFINLMQNAANMFSKLTKPKVETKMDDIPLD